MGQVLIEGLEVALSDGGYSSLGLFVVVVVVAGCSDMDVDNYNDLALCDETVMGPQVQRVIKNTFLAVNLHTNYIGI